MVPCEFNSLLGRYHDGELTGDALAGFQRHLPACASCVAELEEMQVISHTLRAGVMPTASAEFVGRLQELQSGVQDVTIVRFVRRLTAAAAAILVGATIFWSVRQQPTPIGGPVVTAPTADERMVIDPDSAVAMVTSEPTPAAVEPQLEQIALDLSGGRQ
jgi:anti-sigma factor RsiW